MDNNTGVKLIKVSAATDCNKLAESYQCAYDEVKDSNVAIKVRAIGAGAVNQAIKGVIASKKHFITQGIDVCLSPYYTEVENLNPTKDRTTVTAVEFTLKFFPL